MKRVLIILVLGVILLFAGCTLLPWVKDANNIYDWFTKPTEGSLYYKTTYHNDLFDVTDSYIYKITKIDENSDNIVITVNDDETTRYLVADQGENLIFYGKNEYFDGYDDDEVYVDTPVEIGKEWMHNNETREIAAIDTTVEVEAGEYSDVIKVKLYHTNYTGYYYWSISRGMIYKRITNNDNSYNETELSDIHE